jgi:polyhydroxybutyrate depolymerase
VLLNARSMRFVHGRPRLVRALAVAVSLAASALAAAQPAAAQGNLPVPATGPGCAAPITGDRTIKLTVAGRARTALLHMPKSLPGRALPLVIAFHGAGGNSHEFADDSGLSTEGNEYGFAVVYPASFGPQWAISSSPRDVLFAAALLDAVESMACIDQRRVSATGVSIGAGMAARVGCELSSRIAGLVLISGGYRSLPACNPDRPISILEIHGTSDTTVPYSGTGPQHAGAVLPYVAAWAARDRCAPKPAKRVVAAHTILYDWTGCADGASVQHLRIYGGGHGLPNAPGARVSSGHESPISGVRNIWHFLASRSLAPPFVAAPAPAPAPSLAG